MNTWAAVGECIWGGDEGGGVRALVVLSSVLLCCCVVAYMAPLYTNSRRRLPSCMSYTYVVHIQIRHMRLRVRLEPINGCANWDDCLRLFPRRHSCPSSPLSSGLSRDQLMKITTRVMGGTGGGVFQVSGGGMVQTGPSPATARPGKQRRWAQLYLRVAARVCVCVHTQCYHWHGQV